jgi:hypothetical protein
MKVVMTLTARNEADVIDEMIAFHLAIGVDFIIVADNGSTDGTIDVLDRYVRDGHAELIRVPDPFRQIELVTDMARRAATDFGADWVINSDADEFWWPRDGSLKEILAAAPARYGSVRGMWRNFAPRPETDGSFAERMTVRSQQPVDDLHPFNTHFKSVHRGSPDVEVGGGNHDVVGTGVAPLPGWYPLDVLHFPIRSYEQFERKFLRHYDVTSVGTGHATNPFYNRIHDAHRDGRLRELYDEFVVHDTALAAGIADGTLAEDTRLRDALRSLRRDPPGIELGASPVDDGYLVEFGYLEEHSPLTRAQKRMEAIEDRLAKVERHVPVRIARKLGAAR